MRSARAWGLGCLDTLGVSAWIWDTDECRIASARMASCVLVEAKDLMFSHKEKICVVASNLSSNPNF